VVALYLLLLIPEPAPPTPKGAGKQAFLWQRDAFWAALEKEFHQARVIGCNGLVTPINDSLKEIQRQLNLLAATNLPPGAVVFGSLETNFFQLAPRVAACPERLPEFLQAFVRMRRLVKRQSEHWPMDSPETRDRLYRSLYGGRAAAEEAMLQSPFREPARSAEFIPPVSTLAGNSRNEFRAPVHGADTRPILEGEALRLLSPLLEGDLEPSTTPSANVHGVTVYSGDILISRGGAATSALIARGNDFPGNFSHVALVHVDERTKNVSVIESHIESGVGVRPIEAYLQETKLRIMLLRLRSDLPALLADPMLPHKAASQALSVAQTRHIPYDFAMDHADPAKQFCSEVASAAYKTQGVTLWMGLSHLSTPGVTAWLSALGVRHFETQEPSDLEYDPQLRVVAEWRDSDTLFKDHADNAVIDVMLETAERGEKLDYNLWLLPVTRLMKAYSVVLNWSGKVGPIPEGMSAATALRVQRLKSNHAAIKVRLLEKAEKFKAERGYQPPYWELVRLAREACAGRK
jgi:hypothetical protein